MIFNTCSQFILSQSDVVSMVKYSHLISVVLSLVLGIFIFIKAKYNLFSKIFLIFIITFSFWLIGDLIVWTSSNYNFIYTAWSPLDFTEIIFYVLGLYFILVFNAQKDISLWKKILLFLVVTPAFFLTITNNSILGFNHQYCEAVSNDYLSIYKLVVELILLIIMAISIVLPFIKKYSLQQKKSRLIVTGSIFLFLTIFGITEYIASSTGFYELNLYSLFLLPILLVVIIYAVFELDIFHFKILGTQYLVVGLMILIVSQLFFVNGNTDRLLTIITVILTLGLSIILIRNFKRETDQRIYIEKLSELLKISKKSVEETNVKLENANEKLKSLDKLKTEFVSLASHQLRSPLTAIKGYTSMLLEGDYGDINKEAKETVSRIFESSQNLAKVVEDLLNVSKIEQGGMKYEMASFDLCEVVSSMCKDLSITAENKGLKLNFLSEGTCNLMVNGDKEKIRQVVLNFIDNSLKYTKKGEIKVKVEKINDKVVFSVNDSGMGIPPEIKSTLFHKFSRGDGARMNTSGSGLGLYLAKEIINAHNGHVWVESEGLGKGSTFCFDLNSI